MRRLTSTAAVLALMALFSGTAQAQVNAGAQKPEATLPFTVTQVATFNLPWRIAFLPDGRMLITEKVGPVWLVTQQGEKTPVANVPAVLAQGQGGMLGVYVSPNYATDRNVYLTYSEPGEARPAVEPRARAREADDRRGHGQSRRTAGDLAQMPKGRGGQFGAAVAFSPDEQYLFLTVGDRQRMTPAQDPDQALGKILRLTLDGKPAPGNPMAGKPSAATVPLIDPPRDTELAKTAPVVSTYTFPGTEPRAVGDVDHGASHAVRPRVRARRPAVGARARPEGRRRAEPDRARQELRLAARRVRGQLQRHARSRIPTRAPTSRSR